MDLAANELSIYDKLSETVDLVRQTGHQCGMSEKAIEKFIRQLLEKNEPQRGPPQYPLLLAVYKVFITLGLILLTTYFVIQPFSPLPPEPVLSGAYTWRSLIHHIRLMSLPITKKYMPENKGVPLHGGNEDRPFPDFDPWWTNDCEQNESDPIPANCTGCAQKLPLQVMLLEDTPKKFERLHPLVIKMHRMHDLFTIGSGEAMLQLLPPFQCRSHCQSVAMPLEPGDIGYAGATHWKVYIIARGVQPLVVCDGTTLSEL